MAEDPENIGKTQFELLKPLCISLMKQRNQTAITSLRKELSALSVLSPTLLEYVLFPMRITLQQSLRSDLRLLESTLSCVGVALSKTCISSEQTFHEMLSLLCLMIDPRPPPSGSKIAEFGGCSLKSEEMMCCVLSVVQTLLLNTNQSVLESLHSNLPALGHAVYVVTNVLENEKSSKSCLTSAIHTLVSFSSIDSRNWKQLIDTGSEVFNIGSGSGAESFASFLPGIAIALGKLATGGFHKGKNVIMLSILGWSHYVTLVMKNDHVCPDDDDAELNDNSLLVKRSKAWIKQTDEKLGKLSSRIASLVKHESWQVRAALCVWARTILVSCRGVLSTTIGPVIETIVSLSTDEYTLVSKAANDSVGEFTTLVGSKGPSDVTSVLEEKLYQLSTSLPRIMRGADESQKKVLLRLLKGYLSILGSHVCHMTCSRDHISRIIQALAQTIELDTKTVFEPRQSVVWLSEEQDIWTPPLSYLYLREQHTVEMIKSICLLIGRHGHAGFLIDYLLQQAELTTHLRPEMLLITHWMLQDINSTTPLDSLIDRVLVLREELPLTSSPYTTCFILEIFSDCARSLQKEFIFHLQRVLVVIMECISYSNVLVSNTAVLTARLVAEYTGHCSIAGLIIGCADYLVDHVTVHSAHPFDLPSSCRVLQAVISCGSYSILPLLTDCMEALLLSLDQCYCVEDCWRVLFALAKRLPEWTELEVPPRKERNNQQPTAPADSNGGTEKEDMTNIEDIARFFIEYHKKRADQESEELDGEDTMTCKEDEYDEAEKDPTPAVQAAINIVERCTHHMASGNDHTRLCVLDCLELSLTALSHFEKLLLPEVHKVWPAFVHRILDPHMPTRRRAIEVLWTMSRVCGTFLRKRVIEEVWPCLTQILRDTLPLSKDQTKFPNTQQHKILKTVITKLPDMCLKLGVSVSECEDVVCHMIPYLTVTCVKAICVSSLCSMAEQDPDLMWLLMVQLLPSELPHYPSNKLTPVKLPSCSIEEYKEPVKMILSCCKLN